MKRAALVTGVAWAVLIVAAVAMAGAEAIEPKEAITLFNGKDLTGWKLQVGGNADAAKTFYVKDGLIHCTGRPSGYMRTEKDYKNYKFVMEWRFTKPGNSGVLVHMSLPDTVWPKSIECQGMHHNQGDFFVIGGTECKEHKGKPGRRVAKKGPHNEKKLGEWNTYEIVCDGDTIRPHVNGKMMNEATECNVSSGKICVQSEGAVWECRKIVLEPLKK